MQNTRPAEYADQQLHAAQKKIKSRVPIFLAVIGVLLALFVLLLIISVVTISVLSK